MSEYIENLISKNWSNVRILTLTATYTYVSLPRQCLLRGLLLNETGWARYVPGIHTHGIFVSILQGLWRDAIYVQLVCHSIEDRLLPVVGSTVSTVGMDSLFRRL